jgi:hypothetical protein
MNRQRYLIKLLQLTANYFAHFKDILIDKTIVIGRYADF